MRQDINKLHLEENHEEIIHGITELETIDSEMYQLLARAYFNIGYFEEALEALSKVSDQDAYYYLRRGLTLFINHREDESLEYLIKAKELGLEEINEFPGTYYPTLVSEWIERAKDWAPKRKEINDFEKERRSKRVMTRIESIEIDESILEGLFDNHNYAIENYIGKIPSEKDFKHVEDTLGYKLPESYKALMRLQNGGVLIKDSFPNPLQRDFTVSEFNVESIFGVDEDKTYSLTGEFGSDFWIDSWMYPNRGIYFADTISGGHQMIMLDYSDCGVDGEPCIVLVDQESDYEITYIADNFYEFLKGLKESEEDDFDY